MDISYKLEEARKLLCESGNTDSALSVTDEIVDFIKPKIIFLHILRGGIFREQKKFALSLTEFNNAYSISLLYNTDEGLVTTLFNRYTLWEAVGEYKKAIKDLQDCIDIF